MNKTLLLLLFTFSCVAFAQGSLKTVVAEKGDGIYSILRKNRINPTKYYNAFIEANKEALSKEEFLKTGQSYFIPDTTNLSKKEDAILTTKKQYSIFGKEFAKVDSLSNSLKNNVYYLVSGHGGPDPGAVVTYKGDDIAEDEYAYDITLRLARELISNGAEVFLIIKDANDGIRDDRKLKLDTDEVNYPDETIPLNQLARLKQRTKAVNNLYK